MSAPAVLRDVFHAIRQTWGEEDDGITFDNGPQPVSRLDVLVHRAHGSMSLTTFTTIGMSIAPMPVGRPDGPSGGGQRAELRLARRGWLSNEDEHAVAAQLANLAAYPWDSGAPIDWGHLVGLPREFPAFPGCAAAFLSGPLTATDKDYFSTAEGPVRVIQVVPITADERTVARTMPPIPFIQELMTRTDVYSGRI